MENQVRLNCGVNLPIFGFGTFSYQAHSKAIESAVHMAIKVHIDKLFFSSFLYLFPLFLTLFFFDFSDGS